MSNQGFWKSLENQPQGTQFPWAEVLEQLVFNEQGLITAVAQQHDTGEILMLAWMNRQAIEITLQEGQVCYWSRSRHKLWRKGESSGQVQRLKALKIDCDGDALLLQVDQQGPACHTGRRGCFFYEVRDQSVTIQTDPLISPDQLYAKS